MINYIKICPGGEMVYTRDLKSLEGNLVRVRVPPRANKKIAFRAIFLFSQGMGENGKLVRNGSFYIKNPREGMLFWL